MLRDKVFRFCSKCGNKLKKECRGVNVFGEVMFDLVCKKCGHRLNWEELYIVVKRSKDVLGGLKKNVSK